MNLIKYQAFIKVVEMKSITKAAQSMGYSQPGISHMLDSLEKEVGFPLLIRSKDAIRTTDEGEQLLYYCRQIIKNSNDFQETVDAINGLLSGSIHIGAYNSTLLSSVPALIAKFCRAYSKINISVQEYSHSDLAHSLINGNLDLAFMSPPTPNKYEFRPLFHDTYCVIMSHDHPLAAHDKIPVKKLNGCDFIMPMDGCDDIVNQIMREYPFTPHITFHTASDAARIAMAKENLGVYVTSTLQLTKLPDGAIAKEFAEDLYRVIGICLRSFKHASPAAKEFVKLAEQTAKNM